MRYTGPLCRLCRREGKKLFLKGDRCYTQKCGITRKNYVPGKYGKDQMGKKTEFHNQLRVKQTAKRIYRLSEQQFQKYYTEAIRMGGVSGDNFLRLLELRLDNALFRSGFAVNRNQARQIVTHGLLRKDGRRAGIPSMQVKIGDVFEVSSRAQKSPLFADLAKKKIDAPKWLKVDPSGYKFEIVGLPDPVESEKIETQTIVEFYSR